MSQWTFDPVGGYALIAGIVAAFCALLALPFARPPTTPTRRRILLALRAGVLLLVIFAMLRPAWVFTEMKKQAATLVVLVDRSRSMQVTDSFGGKPRWEALRSMIDDAEPSLAKIADDMEVKIYAFDEDIKPLDFDPSQSGQLGRDLGEEPTGQETAIGWVLEEVVRREAGKRLAAVLLLSDGAQRAYAPRDTPPQASARRLADLGYPLYTFVFGQARGLSQAKDLALRDLLTPQTVFVKNQLGATGTLRIDGYAATPITVQLLFETSPGKMDVVGSTQLVPNRDGQQVPVQLAYVPEMPGEFKLTLQAEHQEGELVTTNNQISTFVTVLEGGMRVLYLEGELSSEQTFLRRALDASPDIQLDFQWIDHGRRDAWPTTLAERFQPGEYDVYVIGNLDSAALTPADWQALADRVSAGAGLAMLGGHHSFGPGGYQNTALGDVLPIVMHRLERQRFSEPISGDLHLEGPLKIRPLETASSRYPFLYLADKAQNAAAWDRLPALVGANRFRDTKPAADVLAVAGESGGAPLIVAGGWGNGRVLAFAGDSTWRWVMQGYDQEHKRFWRQIVLWLAKKDASDEGNVWIRLDQRRYHRAGRVEFAAGARSPQGQPVADAVLQAEVILPDGQRKTLPMRRRNDEWTGSFFETPLAGDYTIRVEASAAGDPLGSAQSRFLVYEQDLELDNAAADPGLLSSLAQITADSGGEAMAAEELPGLLRRLQEQPPDLEIETQTKRTYWDTWPFLLMFVALVGTEWYLRKKWGLV